MGELGRSKTKLLRQMRLNKGKISNYFEKAFRSTDFEDNREKYAANVPHLMLYPKVGMAKVSAIKKVVLGDDRRYGLPLSSESFPISTTW